MRSAIPVLFTLLASCINADSFPLFAVQYREVGHVHKEIDALRKDHIASIIPTNEASKLVAKMLANCPSNTYLFIDQPGVEVADFQRLVTPHGIHLWSELRKFAERSGTLASFPRLDAPFQLDRFERSLQKRCDTETIIADPHADPPIEHYEDIRPRIIRLAFDPLPEDEFQRTIELKRNDDVIQNVLRETPSPFFTIIYTSTIGEDFDPKDPEYRSQRTWDIFADLVRSKRDPRNREDWKKHQARERKSAMNEPIVRVPPLAEKERKDAKRKLLKQSKEIDEEFLSKTTVGVILLSSVGIGLLYLASSLLVKAKNYSKEEKAVKIE